MRGSSLRNGREIDDVATETQENLTWARRFSVLWFHQLLRRASGVRESLPYSDRSEIRKTAKGMAKLYREGKNRDN